MQSFRLFKGRTSGFAYTISIRNYRSEPCKGTTIAHALTNWRRATVANSSEASTNATEAEGTCGQKHQRTRLGDSAQQTAQPVNIYNTKCSCLITQSMWLTSFSRWPTKSYWRYPLGDTIFHAHTHTHVRLVIGSCHRISFAVLQGVIFNVFVRVVASCHGNCISLTIFPLTLRSACDYELNESFVLGRD